MRIIEYLSASYQANILDEGIDKVLSCISDAFRKEEENVLPTAPSLKNILILLDSGVLRSKIQHDSVQAISLSNPHYSNLSQFQK
jgi:hypothetical protein